MRFFKHPEQMTPGSFWKVRGDNALRYLEYDYGAGCYHGAIMYRYVNSRVCVVDHADLFELESNYFLVELTEKKSGLLVAKFLNGEETVTAEVYKSLWDEVFELVHKTIDPKSESRAKLLFGKYPVEPFREMIARKNKEGD